MAKMRMGLKMMKKSLDLPLFNTTESNRSQFKVMGRSDVSLHCLYIPRLHVPVDPPVPGLSLTLSDQMGCVIYYI